MTILIDILPSILDHFPCYIHQPIVLVEQEWTISKWKVINLIKIVLAEDRSSILDPRICHKLNFTCSAELNASQFPATVTNHLYFLIYRNSSIRIRLKERELLQNIAREF